MLVDFSAAPAPVVEAVARASADAERAHVQYADYVVEHAAKAARDLGATQVETRVALGKPAPAIVEFAEAIGADLIVTGSRGLGGVKRLLLGSTSQQVAQLAACSCLIAR